MTMTTSPASTALRNLLPEQGKGGLQAPPSRGWVVSTDSDDLERAAKGLEAGIARDQDRRREVVSIPDVWAQADQVAHALFVTNHSRTIAEWRGLMALWALAGVRKLKVSFEALDMRRLVQENTRAAVSETTQTFAAIAHEVLPQVALTGSGADAWRELGLMRYDGRPIALVVPTCLLVPGKNYGAALAGKGIAWFDEDAGRLLDPTATPRVAKDLMPPLAHGIAELRRHLEEVFQHEGRADQRLRAALLDQVDAFAEAIDRKMAGAPAPENVKAGTDTSRDPMTVPLFGVFHKRYTIELGEGMAAKVAPRGGLGPEADGLRGGVLATDNLAQVYGLPRDSIFVWRGRSLAEVRGGAGALDEVRQEAAASGYVLLTEDELFLPRLARLEKGTTIPRHPAGAEGFVLPFSPAVLFFLSPDDLRRRVAIEETGDGVSVKLTLPVTKADGGTADITIERVYSGDALLEPLARPVGPSVWPDFRAPRRDGEEPWWRHYTVFSLAAPGENVLPDVAIAPGQLKPYLADAGRAVAAAVAGAAEGLRNWRAEDRLVIEARPPRRIQVLEEPPEAVLCRALVKDDQIEESIGDVGLVLMPVLAEAPNLAPSEALVGIDFGTTNTALYVRSPDGEPQPLAFESHLADPFESDLPIDRSAYAQEFLPAGRTEENRLPMPFQTLLASRNVPEGVRRVPVLTDFVFFNADIYETARAVAGLSRTVGVDIQIDTNLKWEVDAEESKKEKIRLYLAQVVRQAMVELGARGVPPSRTAWTFSFPKAFSENQLIAFQALCPRAVAEAAAAVPSRLARSEQARWTETGQVQVDRDESEASARYFYGRDKAHPRSLTVTLDIGGGTTDIAIWQSSRLVWRSSLKLAGQVILIDYLQRHFDLVLRSLRGGKDRQAGIGRLWETVSKGGFDRNTQGFIEAVVNSAEFQTGFQKERDILASTAQYQQLELSAELSLAGILYFIGRQMEALAAQDRLDLSRDTCRLCFGGRGSMVFSQVVGAPARKRLAALFQEVAGLAQPPAELFFSTEPKHEVAYGLLAEFSGQAALVVDDHDLPPTVIGEALSVDGAAQSWDRTYVDLPDGEWRLDDLPEFRRLIDLYERRLEREVPFDDAFYRDLIDKVRGRFSELENQARRARERRRRTGRSGLQATVIEPVLVVALREALLKMRADGLEIQKDR